MKNQGIPEGRKLTVLRAFTLVELLVVIGIIGILASLALPALNPKPARVTTTKADIAKIVQAINSYHATYSRYPVSQNAQALGTNDFTFAGTALANVLGTGNWTTANSEVIAILMDLEYDGSGSPTANKGHLKNPQRIPFLNTKHVSDPTQPGVGPDAVYRDVWGTPFVISLDLNYDDKCRDAFYSRQTISQQSGATGFNGLVNGTDSGGNGDNFLCNNGVMVWSLGPDKRIDANQPANAGLNKDNILSWK